MPELDTIGAAMLPIDASTVVYDLSHPLEPTMPISPNHPGYRMALLRRHGDAVRADGVSGANELIVLGGHTGTHFDALAHVSQDGRLHGGLDAEATQKGGRFKALGIETVPPIFCRGILLDIATQNGLPMLPAGRAISSRDLAATAEAEGIVPAKGDAVLIRSGWAQNWSDSVRYLGHESGVPGPDADGAEWLAAAQPVVVGHDSMAFEWLAPGAGHSIMPVHSKLIFEGGIHIIENMDLEELATQRIYEFLFVCLPLRFVGATGSPVRPIAAVKQRRAG